MGDAVGFGVEQIGVIGMMVLGICFSGLVSTAILNSDSYQSVAGEFSSVGYGINMVGTSKQPATMGFIAKLYQGKTYTISSDGSYTLTLMIFNPDGSISNSTQSDGTTTQDIATITTSVQMAQFTIDSKNYDNRFLVNIIPTPNGVILTVPETGGGT